MAYQFYRPTGLQAAKAQEDAQKLQAEYAAKQEEINAANRAQQEGSDIGGILGMIAGGLGAAALIIGTGGLAAPAVAGAAAAAAAPTGLAALGGAAGIGTAIGAAGVGGTLGSAIGKQVSKAASPMQDQGTMSTMAPNFGQTELDKMVALRNKNMPTLSDTTKKMALSIQALGNMPKDVQDEYGNVLLQGITKSYAQDIINSRRRV